MLTAEGIEGRRKEIERSADLMALLQRLTERARPVLERMPIVPEYKAALTADGGICPTDGSRLEFNPWSSGEHRCPQCVGTFRGERHDWAWAHYQHLWLAERAAHLATVAVMAGRPDAAERANAVLSAYRGYLEYPNRDNVLGPSRLFFSTYLESIWVSNYMAAAVLLREVEALRPETMEVVNTVADEAANLIGEFNEGLSNRQTWHNAALASIAVWFEDEELATRAVEGPSGALAHLLQGFGEDGMWYEGDNYHLFALRGELLAMGWARLAGVDMLADPGLAARVAAAMRAPALSSLPDLTFPARKDSRFGVSLAQPMYLELWEVGLARLGGAAQHNDLWGWLDRLYQTPPPPAQTFDSYLHEAGDPPPRQALRARSDLSWWSLLEMTPEPPANTPLWNPASFFFESQGLAILRHGHRYASLECGRYGGGHGHPDRLNLVLHADGEYWLPDFGTGSYVARDLFWYRSTLAHNAPRLDEASQPVGPAVAEYFEQRGSWGWVRGRFQEMTRSIIAGPEYLLDVLELSATDDHLLELPLHLSGSIEVAPSGVWAPARLKDEFTTDVEVFTPSSSAPLVLRSCGGKGATLTVHLLFQGELLRARAPGVPGTASLVPFYLIRAGGKNLRIVSLLQTGSTRSVVTQVRSSGAAIEVETAAGPELHLATLDGWEVRSPAEVVRLSGARRQAAGFQPLILTDRPLVAKGSVLQVLETPALDGTLDGFDRSEPLVLDHEDQYRRSEEPYPGAEEFSAHAYLNWSDEGLYLAVEVTKPEVFARDPNAAPLRLDNEPDEIHGDGIQVYLALPDGTEQGMLIVPAEGGGVLARKVSDMSGAEPEIRGGWQRTDTGFTLTAELRPAEWSSLRRGDEIGFDLVVNQMLPGRQRRAGQLVWSGGGGWVWLRGDRHARERFGILELK